MKKILLTLLFLSFSGICYANTNVTGIFPVYNGHSLFNSNPPVVSACGTSPTVSGNNNSFTITVGSGTVTSCTATFSTAFLSTPVCTVSDNSTSIILDISSLSSTSINITTSATIASGIIYVHCF